MNYKHRDADDFRDEKIWLHDCNVDEITFEDGILRFYFSDGFWITPLHGENQWEKPLRTNEAMLELADVREDAVTLSVFAPTLFNRRKTACWQLKDLMTFINHDKGSLEFICRRMSSETQQIWECELHSLSKPYLRTCELRLPKTNAAFCWNDILLHREW